MQLESLIKYCWLGMVLSGFLSFAGCAVTPESKTTVATTVAVAPSAAPVAGGREKRSQDYVVVSVEAADTYELLASQYLGDAKLAYLISEFNGNVMLTKGDTVAIPLKPANPGGLYPDGYQTVPVLCYHQFGHQKSSNKISVSEETFDRQMAFLKNNGYSVITLNQLNDFIEYRRRPPKKSVLITIDDGWKTARTIAYPILKKYGFTAVLFVYTDLIKSRPSSMTLSWDDINEMVKSGVMEVQSHTVTHADLTRAGDSQLQKEIGMSQKVIQEKTGVTARFLAYPYGNFNQETLKTMQKYGYKAGFTVLRGGNAFFQNTWSLNRSMVFNSDRIEDFAKLLDTYHRDIP